jgi:hypothetical protein
LFHTLVAVGATMAVASDLVFKVVAVAEMAVQEDIADREYDEINGTFHESLAALSTSLNPHLTGTSATDVLEECELKVTAEWPGGFCEDAFATLVKAIADAKDECKGGITHPATKEHPVTSLDSVNVMFMAEPTDQDNPAPKHLREAEQQLSEASRHKAQERDDEMSDCRKNHRQTLHDGLTDSNRVLELVRAMVTQVGEVNAAVAAASDGGAAAKDAKAALEQLSQSLRKGASKLRSQQKNAQQKCNVAAERHTLRAKTAAAAAEAAMCTAARYESGHHGKLGLSFPDLSLTIITALKSAAEHQKLADFETAQCNQLWLRLHATDDEVDAILAKYAQARTHAALQRGCSNPVKPCSNRHAQR